MALKEARQQRILSALQDQHTVSVDELGRHLGVSEVTIRRDLRELAQRGALRRAHGGAVAAAPEAPVIQRMTRAHRAKECIGRAAAALVHDGDAVFIGSGSTMAYVARYLLARRNLTIVTNAVNIAAEFAPATADRGGGITVVVAGGVLRPGELSLVGHIAEQALDEVRVDKVIVGMRAISLEAGMTNDYLPEVVTDRRIIEMAPQLIVAADHTKFGRVASAYIAPVERITTLVTDSEADAAFLEKLELLGVRVVVAEA